MDAYALRQLQAGHRMVLLNTKEFDAILQTGITLPDRHADHFSRVLRRREDWAAIVSDGCGRLVHAVVHADKLAVTSAVFSIPRPSRCAALIQAWVKPKALTLILQKCAELGAQEITLVDTDYSQPHNEKPARLDAILEAACMQAYNPVRPNLVVAPRLTALSLSDKAASFGDLTSEKPLLSLKADVFVNGPEGGWSNQETEYLRTHATGVTLSENVLRAETAAIIAVGILKLER